LAFLELFRRLARRQLLLGFLVVLGLVVVFLDVRRLLEVLDASAKRVTDARQLVGTEDDEDNEQDDDEFAHSGHATLLGNWPQTSTVCGPKCPRAKTRPENLVKRHRAAYLSGHARRFP